MRPRSRRKSALKKAERNFAAAARSLRGTAQLADGAGKVVALRTTTPTAAAEASRMVLEKIAASYAMGMALVGSMMTFGPAVTRRMLTTRLGWGPFGLWQAMTGTALDITTLVLKSQAAMMAPLASTVRANVVRLESKRA